MMRYRDEDAVITAEAYEAINEIRPTVDMLVKKLRENGFCHADIQAMIFGEVYESILIDILSKNG